MRIFAVLKGLGKFLLFLLTLESVFVLHEYGHLREFQKLSIPVEEFSIGIGPVLYHTETEAKMAVNVRLFPLIAYVAPTAAGDTAFKLKSTSERLAVHLAGIRNHLVVALLCIFGIQMTGWWRGNVSGGVFVSGVLMTPLIILKRFWLFTWGCISPMKVEIPRGSLIPTYQISPPRLFSLFVILNVGFLFMNVAPIPGLDGFKALDDIIGTITNWSIQEHTPSWVAGGFVGFYIVRGNKQDLQIFRQPITIEDSKTESEVLES